MVVEMVKMSSKGQIVIPQDIRDESEVSEGTIFAVIGTKNAIVLKKVFTPSKEELIEELAGIAKAEKKHLQAKGIKESDLVDAVKRIRR